MQACTEEVKTKCKQVVSGMTRSEVGFMTWFFQGQLVHTHDNRLNDRSTATGVQSPPDMPYKSGALNKSKEEAAVKKVLFEQTMQKKIEIADAVPTTAQHHGGRVWDTS